MAYTFQKIKDAFGNDTEQKADIFAPQPQQSGGDGAPAQGGGGEIKTSTEGQITPYGQSSGSSPNPVTAQQAQAPKAQIINANLGKVQAPKAFGQIESALGEKTAALQNDANQYVENAKGQNFNTDQNFVHQAAAGDTAARDKIAARLSQPSAQPLEAYTPKIDTNIEGLNAIKSQEGALGLVAKEAGPQYTAGEKALTRSIMERNPQFAQIREALARKANDYEQNVAHIGAQKSQEAQDIVNKNYQAGTDQLRGYLGDEQSMVQQEIAKNLASENANRAQLRARGLNRDFTSAQSANSLNDLRNAYKNDPGLLNQINSANIVPDSFYSVGGDVNAGQVTNADEAARFNRIQALLGGGSPLATGQGVGAAENFNSQGYKDAILSLARQRYQQSQMPVGPAQQGGVYEAGQGEEVSPLSGPIGYDSATIPEALPEQSQVGRLPGQPYDYSSGDAPSVGAPGTASIPDGGTGEDASVHNHGIDAFNNILSGNPDNIDPFLQSAQKNLNFPTISGLLNRRYA